MQRAALGMALIVGRGEQVEVTVTISQPGAPMSPGAAVLDVFDQPAAATVDVTHVSVPAQSWIVVYAEENGVPGAEIGRLSIAATDAIGVAVSLTDPPTKRGAFVALHVDEGVVGAFEYARHPGAVVTGPDRPYIVGGGDVIKSA